MLGQLGRLGNQMFQVASLRGIASNNNYNYAIPPSKNKNEWTDHQLFNPFVFEGVNPLNIQFIDFQRPQVEETSFSFDEKLFNDCPDWVSLVGFFQSEKYFKDIENDIRDDFKFKDELVSSCQTIIENVDNPIALHIRRGDFITNSQNHPPLPLDYYKRALKLFDNARQVIIFSDDTKWCKEQEIFSDDRFLVSEDNDQSYDLCLMSMCDDFIIANSSFSWWGAWLGNKGKVVAPKQWFGKGLNHNTKDLYCSDWSVL